jgi:hypothetical protein
MGRSRRDLIQNMNVNCSKMNERAAFELQKQRTTCGYKGCECEPHIVRKFCSRRKPKLHPRELCTNILMMALESWNAAPECTSLGSKKNTYFAISPARNLKNEPILLGKWSGAGASTSSPGHFYGIRMLITYFSLPLPLPTLINCSLDVSW